MRSVTRRAVFELWSKSEGNKRNDEIFKYIIEQFGLQNCPDDISKSIKNSVCILCAKIRSRWTKYGRNRTKFLKYNALWLDQDVNFEERIYKALSTTIPQFQDEVATTSSRGRPRKLFGESSQRSKRRKSKSLLEEISQEQIVSATQMSLRASGKKDAANIVGELSFVSSTCDKTKKSAKTIFARTTDSVT